MPRNTFASTVAEFIDGAAWLGPDDAPALVTLEALADELDREVTAALAAQFGLTYRNLLKRKPAEDNAALDPLAAALEAANG